MIAAIGADARRARELVQAAKQKSDMADLRLRDAEVEA